MKPRVTVAIPNYNYGRFLGEAIRSAFDQTYPVDEIVVVENGSTDDSLAVALSFDDPRIRVHRNMRTINAMENWNLAFSLATGDYVVLLHSDDVLRPAMIERLMDRALREPDAVMVNCDYDMHYDNGAVLPVGMWYHHGDAVRNQTFAGLAAVELMVRHGDNTIGTTSMQLIKREAILAVRGLDPKVPFVNDWEFSIRLLLSGNGGLANVAEPLVRYRMHSGNATTNDVAGHGDLKGHLLLLERLVEGNGTFGAIAPDAVATFRLKTASRIIARLKQIGAKGDQAGVESCLDLLRRPVFHGFVTINMGPQAGAPLATGASR